MAELSTYFERKYTCPICQMIFTSLAVRSSKVYIGERESDFHTIYKGANPTHYSIIVCPACTYSASNTLFATPLPMNLVKGLSAALTQMPLEKPVDFSKERDLDTVLLSFKLAIRTAQLKKVAPGELAGLLLAAAWITREAGNSESESYYLEEALKHYLQAFQKSSSHVGNLNDVQAAYLIGELYLRNNNYSEAVNWFNIAIFHPNIKMYPAIEKLARDQWSLAREKAKNTPETVPSKDNKSELDNNVSIKTPEEVPPVAEAVTKSNSAPQRRNTMQMMVNLYPDQIEWLNQIVNRGYEASKKVISKDQIIRAIIDALMEKMDGDLPANFSNEKDLQAKLLELLESK
ncbi:MAG: hypothetical protein CVU90_12500 [Firmicutes bacterium HGW-Firmicutes-15]|nr:MAG: hypothetical protein CVU90_12500 [Firmicutes bacterium HGW-Firmicutes-15]